MDPGGRSGSHRILFHRKRLPVRACWLFVVLELFWGAMAGNSPLRAKAAPAPQSELQKKIEKYLRHIYAFGPEVKLTIPEPKESEVAGLLVTTVELVSGESHDTAKMYLSKDGKFLIRGDVSDLAKDPMAETRAKIDLASSPSTGAEHPAVTVVEFADV